jgi:hypothetical protein
MDYKEKLRLAKEALDSGSYDRETIEYIFPELAECEDERIRKAIHIYLDWLDGRKDCAPKGKYSIKDMIDYIEKQNEQKDYVAYFKAKDWYVSKVDGKIHNIHHSIDKDEPKFKVGDILVSEEEDRRHIYKVDAITNYDTYLLLDLEDGYTRNESVYICDLAMYLWSIQDAKDGDVLSYRDGQWIFIYKGKIDDSSFYYHTLYSTIHQDLTINDAGFTLLGDAILPATKKQRDLLFQKMKEAGYEWDANKKELSKIQ